MSAAAAAAAASASASAHALVHDFLVLEPKEFMKLVNKLGRNTVVVLVVRNIGIVHKKEVYIYAVKYGGFTALTKTSTPLPLSSDTEIVVARDIILPPAVWTKLNSIK